MGTARSAAEAATPFIADIKGVRVAFLNYTFMTNGFVVPKGKEFAVNYLNPTRVSADAAAARRQGADLVIAMLHFGTEYERHENAYQRETAARLLAGGVDAIIAAHPHVVQPIEKITVERNGQPFTGVVAYSLGNFISSQRKRYCDGGMMLYLTIEKDAQRGTAVVGVQYLPVWVQLGTVGGRQVSRVVPANPALPFGSDITPSVSDQARRRQVWSDTNALVENQAAGILPYGR
jgi:poly-gamma-glutamate synthesis protein (capsule biosynthesis protein)